MEQPRQILVIQTAFLGDVVLTLPLVQVLKREFPESAIDMVVVPRAAPLLEHHPSVRRVVAYDKRGRDSGASGFLRLKKTLRETRYDLALVPHRSLRSSLLARLSGIPERIGFDKSAGRFLFTHIVPYQSRLHEADRNLSLLGPFGITWGSSELPRLYPSDEERRKVDEWLKRENIPAGSRLAALAPGTVWNTKRWPEERFAGVAKLLSRSGYAVVLVGGSEDRELCSRVASSAGAGVRSASGAMSLLESAELVRRCRLLVANDSAPVHVAVAVGTPVIAIYGATVPRFGFAPYGPKDLVVETMGLSCRPCTPHGGDRCPITTFDCMNNITVEQVMRSVEEILTSVAGR
jgi:heptosyltransferase-2